MLRAGSQVPRLSRAFSTLNIAGVPGALPTGSIVGESLNYARLGDTEFSSDRAEVRAKVINLYRRMVRQMPGIIQTYEINQISPREAVQVLRKSMWDEYLPITDPLLSDRLRYQGEIVLNEALNLYFTKAHVAKFIFKPELTHSEDKPPSQLNSSHIIKADQSSFLSDFLSN